MTDVHSNADLTEASAKGLRWVSVARVASELLMLGSMVLLARLIPPAGFGAFAIAVIVQELAVSIASEGVGTALVQRKQIGREHLQTGLFLGLSMAVVLAAISLALAALVIDPVFGRETALLVGVSSSWFFLGALMVPSAAILRRKLDFRRLAMLDLINTVVRSVTAVALAALAGFDASALVLGGFAGVVAMVALALWFAPPPLPRFNRAAAGDLMSYGGPASLAAICWAGFRNGDYAIIGARLGAAQAGIYWRAFQLAVEYQRKISTVMTTVAFPILARTTGHEAMFELRGRMVRLLTVVVFPLLVCLVLLAPTVVPWLFGESWEPAVVPTQILAGAGAATVVIDATGTVFMAAGRSRALLGFGVAHFAVYILAVVFVSRWGVSAVAIAASSIHGVFVIVAYVMLVHGRPENPFRLLWQDVSAAVVSCAAMTVAALPVAAAVEGSGAPAIVSAALVGVVAGVAYLLTLRVLFKSAWGDLAALGSRVLPVRRAKAMMQRVPLLAGRT